MSSPSSGEAREVLVLSHASHQETPRRSYARAASSAQRAQGPTAVTRRGAQIGKPPFQIRAGRTGSLLAEGGERHM